MNRMMIVDKMMIVEKVKRRAPKDQILRMKPIRINFFF
jgi:hypothetical protein